MRHKYETLGIVLSRTHAGEANTYVTVLTPELGLVRARAQSLRKPGAKLATALTTYAESSLVLVRGKEQWRVAGAVLGENWFAKMRSVHARRGAARVSGLLLRLVAGETQDAKLFPIMQGFFQALVELPEEAHDAAEVLAVSHILVALGLDAGGIPGEPLCFDPTLLADIASDRPSYISRINRGIAASGL